MNNMHPTGIKVDRTVRTIAISWTDNHISVFTFDGLRIACPCVECKGGHANMGKPTARATVANAPETDLELEDIQVVGTYAMQPSWSDGHTTGIYTWTLLRAIDPALG